MTAAEWDPTKADWVLQQRYTTSSRRPGAVISGTVRVRNVQLKRCESCGSMRMDFGGPHSPRWQLRDGTWIQVDCKSQPL